MQIASGQPTFEQIYTSNKEADVALIESSSLKAHNALRESLRANLETSLTVES